MTPNKNITTNTFKKRHIISPNVSISDSFKNCNSESDNSLPRWMCYSPSSRSLCSHNEKDVFDMSVFNAVTPVPSPIDFPTIAWCEDDEIGNSRIEVTPRDNLSDDDDDDDDIFGRSHRRARYSFITRSKSRKRSLCSLDGDNDVPLSPVPSMCTSSCSGLWGHFILPSTDEMDEQADVCQTYPVKGIKSSRSEHRMNFKLLPRPDLTSFVPAKRTRSMSDSFP